MNRAYSLLTIKAVDEDQRVIEGLATTPSPDRLGDIVEPMGAQFKLPIPLLWQHDSHQPIGMVESAKVAKDGIRIKARFAKIAEEGALKNRLDEAWQSIKAGLVRGLSIGFAPIESEEIEGSWSMRFLKWDWLELSAVTIPANSDASILSLKHADRALLSASGQRQQTIVRLGQSPGASGNPSLPKGDPTMKTYAEQIAALEAKRAATTARRDEVQNKAVNEGRTKDAAEKEEFATLSAEIKAIDDELVDLRLMQSQSVAKATPITSQSVETPEKASATRAGENRPEVKPVQHSGIVSVGTRLEPGQKMARWAIALKRAHGNTAEALAIVRNNKAWMDTSPELELVLRAAVLAGDTTTSGWASELVYAQNLANEFIEFLRPQTIVGRIPNLRRVPFNVRMGQASGGSTGYWVGEGRPVPVSKLTTTSQSLGITKAAGLVSIDDELLRQSSPSAELLVRDDLAAEIVQTLDTAFIDPNNGGETNVKPASVLYGVTPVTASGTDYAAIKTDVKALFATPISLDMPIGGAVWVMTETSALALSLMQNALGQTEFPGLSVSGGTWFGLPVITSQTAAITGSPDYGNVIALVYPREIFLADDGQVTISISNEASIEMLDNPTNRSAGSSVATTMVSMFQTNSEAIKAVRYINWGKRRTAAAMFIRGAAYA